MRADGRRDGFTLIEALVALTIAALTLTAIFQLQTQMARSQQRAQAVLAQVTLQENALSVVRDLNMMERPEGQISMPGGDVVRWRAVPLGSARRNITETSMAGRYEVQRFEVTIQVSSPGRRAPSDMVIQRVGWRRLDAVEPVLG